MNEIKVVDENGKPQYPYIYKFSSFSKNSIIDADQLITDLQKIKIIFDYPLDRPAIFSFENPNGFSKYDFLKCVYEGYERIYDEEHAVAGNHGNLLGMLNRLKSDGPYGIWGHHFEDLILEGFEELILEGPGETYSLGSRVFILSIGS